MAFTLPELRQRARIAQQQLDDAITELNQAREVLRIAAQDFIQAVKDRAADPATDLDAPIAAVQAAVTALEAAETKWGIVAPTPPPP